MRPTWAEISLDSIRSNFNEVKEIIGKTVSILAVVKADAYGHGAVEVSKALIESGAAMLGVATLGEALELRENGIDSKIILLGGIQPDEAEDVVKNNLTPACYLTQTVEALSYQASRFNKEISFHLKIDTGMTRLGIRNHEVELFLNSLSSYKNLVLEGVFTHLSCANDEDNSYTNFQLNEFIDSLHKLEKLKFIKKYVHVANSAALQKFPESHYNLVRPGIMLYGSGNLINLDIRPVMKLKTKVVQIKRVPENTHVSYGGTFVTKRDSVLAVLPIGYADGYLRKLSNRAKVSVNGELAPVVGAVCMDLITIDITEISNVGVGDEVVLFGDSNVGVEDVSLWAETIPYEIMSIIGKRIPRIYY
ncbi:MAG: alanine racemase [Thermodesulfobacteriota bacterium]